MADAHAPEPLLAQHAHVRALARRLVFDAELAAEVEQETWLAALAHAPRDLRDPRAWLARVVQHAARRLRARRARRGELEFLAGSERAQADDGADPARLLERAEAVRALLAAVARLPEPVRAALVWHHLDGLPLAEVAHRSGAPLETVRSRVKRGLELLRAELARERRNDAWALFLVRGLELAPPSLARGLGLVARDSLLSLILMGTTGKFVLSATALALLVGFLIVQRAPTERTRDAAVTPIAAVAELAPGEPRAREDAPLVAEPTTEVLSGRRDAARLVPAAASARTGTLVLDVRWGDDGTPAGGVDVRVSAANVAGNGAWGTTSAAGRLEFEVAPGFVLAQCILGGLSATEVAAGERNELELEIPPGIRVLGRVEDEAGVPVASAELFLSLGVGEDAFEGRIVARSDERGAFTLRSAPVGLGVCLSARAAGFAPSEQVVLSAPSSELAVRLVLDQPGRALAGRVLDPEGAPVAGASVLVGSEYEWEMRLHPDGSRGYPPIGEHVTTDASGRFALLGVPRDAVPVRVRAAGHPVWLGEFAEDAPGELTIRLARGARVFGTVRTEDGTPLAGIQVRRAGNGSFAACATTSAADGTYVLEPLAPGPHVLVVERPASGPGWLQAEPAARLELELAPGEERRFDPRLAPERVLRGRIEAPGQELEGWT
ncbi:MAG: sigma-70 family RNA polymerase sigma factor, partial [Planctomycetota bacterium]